MMMVILLLIPLWLATAVLAWGLWTLHRRSQETHRRLAQESHDRALALAQRCDAIDARLGDLHRQQRIDHLAFLVTLGEEQQAWKPETTPPLRRFVAQLYSDSQAEAHPEDRQSGADECA